MRRRVLIKRVVAFLLLGVVANTLVAWSIAQFAGAVPIKPGNGRAMSLEEMSQFWQRYAPPDWPTGPMQQGNGIDERAPGRADKWVAVFRDTGTPQFQSWGVSRNTYGWPTPSLSLRCQFSVTGSTRVLDCNDCIQLFTVSMTAPQQDDPRLPLRPIWPGFVIDTLFYATVLWLLFVSPSALRRFFRRKRGRCVACAYDLRGVPHVRCPACGEPVRGNEVTELVSPSTDSPADVSNRGGN